MRGYFQKSQAKKEIDSDCVLSGKADYRFYNKKTAGQGSDRSCSSETKSLQKSRVKSAAAGFSKATK